ncbi:MAG: hypothetical protein HC898_05340 [Phycisphaerales bacterium]|nr:hypothetical protein [Phycisphaerales bacterium]
MIDQLEPGQKVTLPFTVVFSEAQPYRLMAELGADALPIDNQRHLSAWVQPGVGVLLVSGGGQGQGQRRDTFYLEQALQPKGTVVSGNLVEVVSQSRLETLSFEKYQVIFLCNLPGLSEIQSNKLETWVKSGGTLVVFLGDQIDVQTYNRWMHQAGQGLLPGMLTAVQGEFQADQFAG